MVRTSSYSGPPNPSHDTHIPEYVTVHYRWHALFQQTLAVERFVRSDAGTVIQVRLPDGPIIALPAWMIDSHICTQHSLGSPYLSIDTLIEFKVFIDQAQLQATFLSNIDKQKGMPNEPQEISLLPQHQLKQSPQNPTFNRRSNTSDSLIDGNADQQSTNQEIDAHTGDQS